MPLTGPKYSPGLGIDFWSLIVGSLFFLLILGADYSQLGFAPQRHAYASLVCTIGALFAALTLVGLGLSVAAPCWAWRGHCSARQHLAVDVTALFWYFVIGA